jgi:hypothetical protein
MAAKPYINPTKRTLSFALGGKRYSVEPEAEFVPPERYAYAIEAMGLPLVTLEEFTAPSDHQKLKLAAAEARARAETLAEELAAKAAAADLAARKGDDIAPRLESEAKDAAQAFQRATTDADDAAVALLKSEAPTDPVASPAPAAEAPKPPVKAQPQPSKKSGK